MSRLFAVVPAAGRSRRMGRPKLLLPVDGEPVLARLLRVLDRPGVVGRVVVVRRDDDDLAEIALSAGALVVRPAVDPPDTRASVDHALAAIADRCDATVEDGWMLVPADHPELLPETVDVLVAAWRASSAPILLPTYGGRRGHPALFRWPLAAAVRTIPPDRGVNHLVAEYADAIEELAVDDAGTVRDLDTPEDYERLVDS